ncbi:MAG: hypothetical protein F4Y94_00525, partial [Chloroflexi bacterium]|nr:hypothetical protein [Chloroflexota bacterium]
MTDSPATPADSTRPLPDTLIDGVRVVELCDPRAGRVAAAFTGKLLATFGADVVKVEPPGGDASRREAPFATDVPSAETSATFLQYNTGKRGVTLDVTTSLGFRLLESLLDSAGIFLTDLERAAWPPGLPESVERRVEAQALLAVAVTPFGLDGPDADAPSAPLTVAHASAGPRNLVSGFGARGDEPMPLPAHAFAADAGLCAAVATTAALHERASSGLGQLIDASEMEAIATLDRVDTSILVNGPAMNTDRDPRDGMMECHDGFAFLVTGQGHQWRSMLRLMGDPGWAFGDDGEPRPRSEIAAESRSAMQEWVAGRGKAEVYHATQAAGIPTGPVLSPTEVLASEQEAARGFFEPVAHPIAGTLRYPGYSARFGDLALHHGPAPTLGQHNAEILAPLLAALPGGRTPASGPGIRAP